MVSITDARKYVFAAISILSVPSAYAAGFMAVIGPGVSNLLDANFFAQELTRLVLILTGFLLIARFSLSLALSFFKIFSSKDSSSLPTKRLRVLTYIVRFSAILFVAPAVFLWITLFLDVRLIPSFSVMSFWLLFGVLLIRSISISGAIETRDHRILSNVRLPLSVSEISLDAKTASAVVFFAVLTAGNFGYHRAIALAISQPVCISTGDKEIYGSIIGQTSFGFIISQVETGEFHSFTFPSGIAILYNSTFSFISAQQDLRISTNCSRWRALHEVTP